MNAKLITSCDETNDDDIKRGQNEFKATYETCDFIIHVVAFANKEDLGCDFSNVTRQGWDMLREVEAHSFVAIAKHI